MIGFRHVRNSFDLANANVVTVRRKNKHWIWLVLLDICLFCLCHT